MVHPFAVVFAPEAAAEVTTIAAWWHKNRRSAPGLFWHELKQALSKIAAQPEIGGRARLRAAPDARAVVLQQTAYVVFYDVDPDASEIHVLRVRHAKRRPLRRAVRR